MKFYETPEFKELNSKWRRKLEKSGFEDIEQDDGLLKLWTSHFYLAQHNPTKEQAKEEYYRLAGQLLYDYKFKSEKERFIWSMHSEGKSLDYITKELKRKRYKIYRGKVYQILKPIIQHMLVKCKSKT